MKMLPTKKVIICFILFLFNTLDINAQERYRVNYDYKTESVIYLSLDKKNEVVDTLEKPKFKRQSNIELQLKNVNPFAVKVVSDVKEKDLTQTGQGFNFSSLLGGLNSFSGSSLNLNTSELPESDEFLNSSKSRSAAEKATSNFEDLNNTITNISALKSTLVSNLLNPNLDKAAILKNVLNTADAELDVRLPSAKDNFYVYLAKVEKSIQDSKSELKSNINKLSSELENEVSTLGGQSRGELIARNMALSDLQKLITNLENASGNSISTIEELRSLFTTLEASSFEQIYDYELSADEVNIELKFIQSDFSQDIDKKNTEAAIIKTRNIKLTSKGGFKINTSVAMTLNNFGNKSNDYFINEEGLVGAESNDYFVPNLSTMINFYPFISKNFNIGGSFGLSIPISGNDNINGINFLFGPSLFFGSKSRLALSGGLAFGPITKLTNGIEVSDTTSFGNIDSFTKTVYDFGYYFGISFSLFNLN